MALWLMIAAMCLLATMFVAWPLYRSQRRMTVLIAVSVSAVVLLSLGLYSRQGSPDIPSGAGTQPDVEEMVAALAARLDSEPDDLAGWKMLGRSYMNLQDYASAVNAFERAVAIEQSQTAQTLVDLGAALLARDNAPIDGRTAALFESALALEPNHPEALFYGGIAALNRGNKSLAADRWEILLALNPPEEIRGILGQRIAEWRGAAPPAAVPPLAAEVSGTVLTVELSIAPAALQALPAEASVFVIARDPEQPSPPIAVVRRVLSELPTAVALGDANAMIPGRSLSAFEKFEVLARVSVSGQPIAQSGDWFGSAVVTPAEGNTLKLQIDQQVP